MRTGDVPVVTGSAYHPFGVDVVDGPIDGSSAAYFDGEFPALPTGNTNGPMWHHSLAHNLVLEVPEAKMMAYGYLISGTSLVFIPSLVPVFLSLTDDVSILGDRIIC